MSERQLIHSVTRKDFRVEYYRGPGNGGQNRNKRDTCCRISHKDSGAVASACEERSQLQNKRRAFRRLVETKKFQSWLKLQTGRALLQLDEIEAEIAREVERAMRPENLLVETVVNGEWTPTKGELC